MKEKLFHIGVSDWDIEFVNKDKFSIISLTDEKITSEASGKTIIELTNVTLESDLFELIREGCQIKSVIQKLYLRNSLGSVVQEIEFSFFNPKVKEISMIGSLNSVTLSLLTIEASE